MAAAAVSQPVINLNTQANFPIRLGTSILQPRDSKRFASVRYNHKPRLSSGKEVECTIVPRDSGEKSAVQLDLNDGGKQYAFRGEDVSDGNHYVLLAKGSGKDAVMILEKLQACHDFNLTKAPEEKSQSALARRHPQLPQENAADDGLFGDEDVESIDRPDRKNPFDYRNYLKVTGNKARDHTAEPPRSGASTPQLQPRATSTTPHSRPSKRSEVPLLTQKKRKGQENLKTNPKRVKAGTEPPASEPMAAPTRKDIPKLRMDRKASLHVAPVDNSGELIVENETPIQEKPRSAMALALAGQLGRGPISLHSAASSPASRAASPAPKRPKHIEEGEDFELGELSSPERQKRASGRQDANGEDEDADADVEDLELPSPAQTHRHAHRRDVEVVDDKPGGEDEDDLDKQLALAMAEEDEGEMPPPPVAAESDEESEEE